MATLLLLRPARTHLSPDTISSCSPLQNKNRRRTIRNWTRRLPRASLSAASGQSSAWEREEARWLREEQRWLREEQRWIREELRWNAERESLVNDIAALKLRIEELENQKPRLTLLRTIEESGIRVPPAALVDQADVKEMILEEVTVSESTPERIESREENKAENKRALRKGAEGDDVRAMQEALHRLGFYSGEEDMEFESFSSGTERAVKTWQASLGAAQNGIMSVELLEKLFNEPREASPEQGGGRGAAKEGSKEVEEGGGREVEVSHHRVFLLGENRWEDPGRLGRQNGPAGGKVRCLTCRGEGRLMCTECDGTGEPNIEPQFLEWVEEGTKCSYCEGRGFVPCDVCGG